jgi:hypothetical protein
MILFILTLATQLAWSTEMPAKDKSLKKKDAPAFLIEATPKGSNIEDVEYFLKTYENGTRTYELKYELDDEDEEVSLTYSSEGKLLEKEQDIKFSSLPSDVRSKIEADLKKKYSTYAIEETERRTLPDGKILIDVEVSHGGGDTGLTEETYSTDGKFISSEEEEKPAISTLN